MNRKPVIGILPTSNYMLSDDTFKDTYRFGNNYIKKIVSNGGIPLLIPFNDDEVILDTLELCDGLLLPGGSRILKSNFDVIKYFYDNKKPMFGICMGMQTLAMFSVNMYEEKRIINSLNDNSHWPVKVFRDNNSALAHYDIIDKDTIMYDIFGTDRIHVNSLHNCFINEVGNDFKVSITSEDGIIEGIEYKDSDRFIIGVQFHPEILPQFSNIFKRFIDECSKISTK